MLSGLVDRQLIEYLEGQISHEFVDDLTDRLDTWPVLRSGLAWLAPALLKKGKGFLQDGGVGWEAASPDFLADEALPVLRSWEIHGRYLREFTIA
jgi:hypothetical protein